MPDEYPELHPLDAPLSDALEAILDAVDVEPVTAAPAVEAVLARLQRDTLYEALCGRLAAPDPQTSDHPSGGPGSPHTATQEAGPGFRADGGGGVAFGLLKQPPEQPPG